MKDDNAKNDKPDSCGQIVPFRFPEEFHVETGSLAQVSRILAQSNRIREMINVQQPFVEEVRKYMRNDLGHQMQELMREMDKSQRIAGHALDQLNKRHEAIRPFVEPAAAHIEDMLRETMDPLAGVSESIRKMFDDLQIQQPSWEPLLERLGGPIAIEPPRWVGLVGLQLERANWLSEIWPTDSLPFQTSDLLDSTSALSDDLADVYAADKQSGTLWMHDALERHVDNYQALVDPGDLEEVAIPEPFSNVEPAYFTAEERAVIDGIRRVFNNLGPDSLRHLCSSLRQLHNMVLTRLAPERETHDHVINEVPENLHPRLIAPRDGQDRPTWNGRVFYAMRHATIEVRVFMLETDMNAAGYASRVANFIHRAPVKSDRAVAVALIKQLEHILATLFYFATRDP